MPAVMLGDSEAAAKPVIARVHGIATAAGLPVCRDVDLAVAALVRIRCVGHHVGLFCATPGVALTRHVTRKPAFEML